MGKCSTFIHGGSTTEWWAQPKVGGPGVLKSWQVRERSMTVTIPQRGDAQTLTFVDQWQRAGERLIDGPTLKANMVNKRVSSS